MELSLTVVRYKTLPPPQELCLTADEQGCTIGRNPDNDLALPDPELFISSTHAKIQFREGAFCLIDTSTNGTFINNAKSPVGRGNSVELHSGDELIIGDYVIRLAIRGIDAMPSPPAAPLFEAPTDRGDAGVISPDILGGQEPPPDILDLFGEPKNRPISHEEVGLFQSTPALSEAEKMQRTSPGSAAGSGVPFPEEFDLFGTTPSESTAGAELSEADHTPTAQDSFTPPQAIPEDYDILTGEITQKPEPVSPPIKPSPQPQPEHIERQPTPQRAVEEERVKEERVEPQVEAAPQPQAPPRVPTPAAAKPRPAARAQPASPSDTEAFQAFLTGLGHPDVEVKPEDIPKLMLTAGQLVRQTTDGLMKILSSRTSFKSELRIEMTTIRPVENNPLKFSTDVDDALSRMFFEQTKGYQPPIPATQNALDDILAHEMAIIAGLRAALTALLKRFDPEQLEQKLGHASKLDSLLPMAKKAKYWDLFTEIYEEVSADAEEGFMRLFSEEFTRAYEQQVLLLKQARSSNNN